MKAAFYLQRADETQVWEQVDEYVWDNATKVVMKDGASPRYSGNGVIIKDNRIEILGLMTEKDVGIICRFLNIRAESGTHPNGFLQNPEYVKIKRGKNATVHELGSKIPSTAETIRIVPNVVNQMRKAG